MKVSLIKSIVTVGGFTMVSRVTGFVRDVLIANFLGAGLLADAFFVAFKLPNLFRSLFAEGAFNVAFVPLFSELMETQNRQKALEFGKEAFSALFYIVFLFCAVMEAVMPAVVFLQAPGFAADSEKMAAAVFMSRITFPYLLLVSLNSLQSGVLNSAGKFAAAALTPVILNLTMIASLFAFTPLLNGNYAYALSCGVTAAGVLQLIWLIWHTRRAGLPLGLAMPLKVFKNASTEVRLLLKRVLPGVFGSGIYQINLFLDTMFVSFLSTGAVSWLYYANRLYQLPVGIIGAAIGTVLLPVLTRQLKAGQMAEAEENLHKSVLFAVFVSVPCAAALIALNYPIISVLFERGAFDAQAAANTGTALAAYAVGLPAYLLTKTFAPVFYARGDTATPVKIAACALIAYIGLCFLLLPVLSYAGIALATAIVAWLNLCQYVYYILKRKLHAFPKRLIFRVLVLTAAGAAAGVCMRAAYGFSYTLYGDWPHGVMMMKIAVLCGLGAIGGVVFLAGAFLGGAVPFAVVKGMLARRGK